MIAMRRTPAVAGIFYPAQPDALKAELAYLLPPCQDRQIVKAVVSPHAGIAYSGAVAGAVYGRIHCPEIFILLGPNHRGVGEPVALMAEGEWETPLGVVPIDREVAMTLRRACPLIAEDSVAHTREHSLEVQLPFLQMCGKAFHIVPLVLGLLPYAVCQELGHAVAQTVQNTSRSVVIVASTDMTHCGRHYQHLPPAGVTAYAFAYQEDRYAIDRMVALDPEGLYQIVRQRHITMCGVISTTVALLACQELGATSATLVRYLTSGDVSGDLDTVVGYAGLLVT
jgi:AmmeMemoRadiSam system protein B